MIKIEVGRTGVVPELSFRLSLSPALSLSGSLLGSLVGMLFNSLLCLFLGFALFHFGGLLFLLVF